MNVNGLKTPCYVVDEVLLEKNLERLADVSKQAGCKILLAQKAFSMFRVYPLIRKYLHGTSASGLFEAKLGYEEMGGETHVFSTAYKEEEMPELLKICDHVILNSFSQLDRYRERILKSGKKFGIRINPECSTQVHDMYDPCSKGSRLGVTIAQFERGNKEGISGIHFHTLCEQNSDALKETLQVVEEKFGDYLHKLEWVNFGGGHHITREDYDKKCLVDCIKAFRQKYEVEVYLEPGEAIALNAGFLVSEILDITENSGYNVILDTSAACHMPDVLEMPYRPTIIGAGVEGEKQFNYRMGGVSCLAGDSIGTYSFDAKLQIGDRIVFADMAIYSMVKNNTFNGINLPNILLLDRNGTFKTVKEFQYEDFKGRLS